MAEGTDTQLQAKREYTQLLRLHEQLLAQFSRARDELLAPGTASLVKQIKARTGSEPDLTGLKTAVEETIRTLKHAFHLVFRSRLQLRDALAKVRTELGTSPEVARLLQFLEKSERGFCR